MVKFRVQFNLSGLLATFSTPQLVCVRHVHREQCRRLVADGCVPEAIHQTRVRDPPVVVLEHVRVKFVDDIHPVLVQVMDRITVDSFLLREQVFEPRRQGLQTVPQV